MRKLSLITGLACVTSLSSYAGVKALKQNTEITAPVMHCCMDGNSVGKRYTVNHKGKRYVTCSKKCAHALKKQLELV